MSKMMVTEDYIPGALRVFSKELDEVANIERLVATNDLQGRSFMHNGRAVKFLGVHKALYMAHAVVIWVDPYTNTMATFSPARDGHSVVWLDFIKED